MPVSLTLSRKIHLRGLHTVVDTRGRDWTGVYILLLCRKDANVSKAKKGKHWVDATMAKIKFFNRALPFQHILRVSTSL